MENGPEVPEKRTITMVFGDWKSAISKDCIFVQGKVYGDEGNAAYLAKLSGRAHRAKINPRSGPEKSLILGVLDNHFKKPGDAGIIVKLSISLDPVFAAYFTEIGKEQTPCAVTFQPDEGQLDLPGFSKKSDAVEMEEETAELSEDAIEPEDEMDEDEYDDEYEEDPA